MAPSSRAFTNRETFSARKERIDVERCKAGSNVARATPSRDPESSRIAPAAAYSESVRCGEMNTSHPGNTLRRLSSHALMPASPVLISWPPPTRHTTTAQSA